MAEYTQNTDVQKNQTPGIPLHVKPLLPTSKTASSLPKKKEVNAISLTATPNPFSHSLKVSFKSSSKKGNMKPGYKLLLANAYGTTLLSKPINNNVPVLLDTKSYLSGMYVLSVKSLDGIVQSIKVIKIKE